MNQPRVSFTYPTIMQALTGMLVESCLVLTDVEYVVGGGWVPYLRGAGNALTHPGTKDVDLAFRDGRDDIKAAARRLGAAGYLPSAQTPFTRHKVMGVKNRPFVFNIDLLFLEPEETRIVLDEKLWSPFEVEATVPTGEIRRAIVPLMDETGLVLMKSVALWQVTKSNKRTRDAFDIFFILSGPSGQQVARQFKALGGKSSVAAKNFSLLTKYVHDYPGNFNRQVQAVPTAAGVKDPAGQVALLLAAT